MSFKAFVSSAAIAGTLVTAALVTPAPAEAATIAIGSTVDFSSLPNGTVSFNPSTNKLDFNRPGFIPSLGFAPQAIEAGNGTGDFVGTTIGPLNIPGVSPFAQIMDLTLVDNGGGVFSLAAPVSNFISFRDLLPLPTTPVQFTLTKFIFDFNQGRSTALEGFFTKSGDTTLAKGLFTSQVGFNNPSSFSLSLETVPIPTPALLPGLVGMGAAALRRRKEEASEENA